MQSLTEHQLLMALLALAVILLLARGAGELARRIGQPEVLGELFAGFLLGPSVFGVLLPSLHGALFQGSAVSLVLSGFSWIGAIMVLLVAGMEVDLAILRREARPGILAGALAIVPSLVAGSLFAIVALGKAPPGGFFLGIVLSVTAVSVAAKILIERDVMRRRFAQIILAAGIASEVVVWFLISVVSAFHSGSPLLAGARTALFGVAFFVFMLTLGRRFTFWAMRRVRDAAWIVKGQLSLVLVLTFVSAALTQALGLHALLGAFVFGVILGAAPRSNQALTEGIQSLTVGLFGPIFFALAGMRVDILRLGSPSSVLIVLALLVVATTVKVGLGALGARLGGQPPWESLLIGVGLNLKGGTDVVVAVVGTELGLLSGAAYTMYTVVAILTVLFSPPLLAFLEAKAPPAQDEQERLESEEAQRRSYVPKIERVLVPVGERVRSSLAAGVVRRIATIKHEQGQIFDITEMEVRRPQVSQATADAHTMLSEAGSLSTVEVTQQHVRVEDALGAVLRATSSYDLVAIGTTPPTCHGSLSFGQVPDSIIDRADCDVLVAVDPRHEHFDCGHVSRILVPTNGMEYSMAAGDVAGSLAKACDAEVTLFHAAPSGIDARFWRERQERRLQEAVSGVVRELAFRLSHLGIPVSQRVEVADRPGEAILRELQRGSYDLVVMGAVDRGHDGHVYLGDSVTSVLTRGATPALLLVSRA